MSKKIFKLNLLSAAVIAIGGAALVSSCGGSDSGGAGEDAASSSGAAGKAALAAPLVGSFAANGWYWNPSEGGTGFMFEAQGHRGFVAFFMYEETTGKPIWYAAYGAFAAGAAAGQFSFTGDLRVYRGGQAVSAGLYTSPTWTSVGPVSIAFTGNQAQVQLPGGRRIAGERYVIDGSNYNFASPVAPNQSQPEVGWYWNPAEGGRGYGIEVQNNKIFMAMFHYNLDGSPTWNVAQGDLPTGSAVQAFEMYVGGQSLTSAYRGPTKTNLSPFTFSFRNACAGQMQYAGAPAITVQRFRIDETDIALGAECNAVTKNVFPLTPGLRTGGAVMEPGDRVFGKLNAGSEVYTHGFNLQAGRSYTFTAEGAATGAGSLASPALAVYNGSLVEQAVNRLSPGSLSFTPGATGVYYLAVRADPAGTGSYLLKSSGTASGISAQAAPPLASYAGNLSGSFTGRVAGNLTVAIDAVGKLTGSVVRAPSPGTSLVVAGTVVAGGAVSFTATGGGVTMTFQGYLSPQGMASGVWSDGGGPGGMFVMNLSSGGMAVIDTNSITKAITDYGNVIAVCSDGSSGAMQSERGKRIAASILTARAALASLPRGGTDKRALALTGTPPADELGSCGGRYGYRNYSHVSGTTTATLSFENYCQSGDVAGETVTTNGSIAFVNTANPTPSGPITTQLNASSSTPLTTVTKNGAGATIRSDTQSFSSYRAVVGVPGGTPTAAQPDRISLAEITTRNNLTGKTYRQTGYSMAGWEDPAGNSSWTLAGRGYRSDGSSYEIATPQPMVQNANGDSVSGQLSFTGANGSNAVATVVPGEELQFKLSVNGVPFTNAPACTR